MRSDQVTAETRRTRWAVTAADTRYWQSDDVTAAERMLAKVDGPVAAAYRAGLMLLDGRTAQAMTEADRVLRDPATVGEAIVPALATVVIGAALSGRFDRVWIATEQAGAGHALFGYVQCFSLVMSGQVAEARRLAEDGHRAAVDGKKVAEAAGWSMLSGVVANAGGDLTAAVADLGAAVELLETRDPYRLLAPALSWLAAARAMCGERAEAQHTLRRAAETPVGRLFTALSGLSQAWVTAAGGDTTLAARQAAAAADVAMANGQFAVEAVARYDVARLGDPHTAYRRLATLAGVVQGRSAPAMAAAACALSHSDPQGLDRAAKSFTALGFALLAEEATTAAAAIRNQPTAVVSPAATPLLRLTPALVSLTRRERDVALLVADGMTSSAIGARLQLSARTVDNCLGRVYQKLGVTNRRDVVPLVRRHSPGPDPARSPR